MLTRLVLYLSLILLPAQAWAGKCHSAVGAIVPDADTARQIAAVVIAAHQSREISEKFTLNVEPDGGDSWTAFQHIAVVQAQNGDLTVTRGGGGLSMSIDRCTGAVSNVYYQR